MVSGFDMDTIAALNGLGGKGGGSKQPMNGGKPTQKPATPPAQEPVAPETTLKADPAAQGAGAPDLAGGAAGAKAGSPDTSGGLGSMGSQDKLNMIAKLYGGGMGGIA